MYMAYGWPQVIPLESALCPSSQQIIYLRVVNRLLLVVSPTHLELWSSAQVPIHLLSASLRVHVCQFDNFWFRRLIALFYVSEFI